MSDRLASILVIILAALAAAPPARAADIALPQPVSQTGTVTFQLSTDKTYRNGKGQENYSQQIVELPGIMQIEFRRRDPVVNIVWTWTRKSDEGMTKFHDILVDLADLPGPETYFLQFTWDSARGLSEAYFNGRPLRVPGARFSPWWVHTQATKLVTGEGALKIEQVEVKADYTPPQLAMAAVPDRFFGRHNHLIGFTRAPGEIDVTRRRGKLLYQSLMDSPESLEGWVAEGPMHRRYRDGSVLLRAADFANHFVFWCPQDFPERFVAEWDFEPLSHYGLAIVFFAARGQNGEDIFDPALPKRDGNFRHYIRGAITSYHISYFANIENFQMGRVDSNMRKNNQFYRVGGGPIAIPPGASGWHHMRLVKDGNHIQLSADGQVSVDWTDDNAERYGPPHGGGKIGLRQMSPTVGAYRNFRVWALEGE